VQHVLWEVRTVPLEGYAIYQLVEVVGKLKYVEIVEILGHAQARIVLEIVWLLHNSAQEHMQKVTVLLQKDFIQERYTDDINYKFENPFPKHMSLLFPLLALKGELSLWDNAEEYFIASTLERVLH
jgi:hypothetical protein